MIASYCDTNDLQNRIEGLLVDAEIRSTNRRDEFQALVTDATAGIAGLGRCSDADVDWLRALFPPGLAEPACVVVTPLSVDHVQRLRRVISSRVEVVWVEELDDRLVDALDQVDPWHADPLRLLGRRLLSDRSFHRSVDEAIRHICNLSGESPPDSPTRSVQDLARVIGIPSDALRRYWRKEVPLECGLKQLLSWGLLLWAVRQRADAKWETIARRANLQRRTLERHSMRLAECTLAVAARNPVLLKRRFKEWIAAISQIDPPATLTPLPLADHVGRYQARQRQSNGGSYNRPAVHDIWTPLPGSPGSGWNTPLDRVSQARAQAQT